MPQSSHSDPSPPTTTLIRSRSGSRYAAVQDLVRWIKEGKLRPGERLPAERLLAEQLGVSRPTIRAAIQDLQQSGILQLGDGRIRKIALGAIKSEGNLLGKCVAIITDASREAPHLEIPQYGWEWALQAICIDAAASAGMPTIVLRTNQLREEQVRQILRERPRGVIALRHVVASPRGREVLAKFLDAGIPVVVNSHGPTTEGFDRVVSDHAFGAYQLTRMLIERGCRRILRYRPLGAEIEERPEWLMQRDEGYLRAIAEAGIAVIPPIEFRTPIEMTQDLATFELMQRATMGYLIDQFSGKEPIDGIEAVTDSVVFPLVAALERLGKAPQRDVLVVGYDNNWSYCEWRNFTSHRPLATVDKENDRIGRELIELLMERTDGRLPPAPQCRLFSPQVVVLDQG